MNTKPTREDIAKLAYMMWWERSCREGGADLDWLAAEEHLRSEIKLAYRVLML